MVETAVVNARPRSSASVINSIKDCHPDLAFCAGARDLTSSGVRPGLLRSSAIAYAVPPGERLTSDRRPRKAQPKPCAIRGCSKSDESRYVASGGGRL